MLPSRRLEWAEWEAWLRAHLQPTDKGVIEATTNTWTLYDQVARYAGAGASARNTANAAIAACFLCAGQSCTAGERLLVHRAVREDFVRCLGDVEPPQCRELQRRIGLARSLRELWHLRAELYRVVAIAHSQS